MKSLSIVSMFALLFTASNVFAAAAVSYSCVGKNKANGEAIVFDLLFADSAPKVGYTNQSITITKQSGVYDIDKAPVLQMFDATAKNECQKNSNGEIYLNGKNFSMDPPPQGSLADYQITFKLACKGTQALDVTAYCVFDF